MKYNLTLKCVKDITNAYLEDQGKFGIVEIVDYSLYTYFNEVYLQVNFLFDNEPDIEIIPIYSDTFISIN